MSKTASEYDESYTKAQLLEHLHMTVESNVKALELIDSLTSAVALLKKCVEQLENERSN